MPIFETPIPQHVFELADSYNGDWTQGDIVRGEKFEKCKIVCEDEAWDLFWDSADFEEEVDNYMTELSVDADTAIATAKYDWREKGIDKIMWLHLRSDGYVEVDEEL